MSKATKRELENPVVHFTCDIPSQIHSEAKLTCIMDGTSMRSVVIKLFMQLAARAPKVNLKSK